MGRHHVAVVDDGDGLDEHTAHQVGGAEVDQGGVDLVLRHPVILPDGHHYHDVEQHAGDGHQHVCYNHQSSLMVVRPMSDIYE